MTEIVVGLTLKADGSGFVGEVRVSEQALKKMGDAARDSARGQKTLESATRSSARQQAQATRATANFNRNMARQARNAGLLQRRIVQLVLAYGGFRAVRAAVNSFADFEKGLIGVDKTANLNASELALLAGNIDALSTRLPISRDQMLEIAQAAGQLGVKGVADLTLFVETVGKMGLASDLFGAEAATVLARILTVTKEGVGGVDRLASVIVDLGNNFAASEAEIAGMTTRVAQATALFGVMSHEAAGMGAAMKSMGVEAEAGGTVVGRAFQAISDAVRNGGEELETIARITGTTGAEVRRTFGDNATEAFRQFVVGLGRIKDEGGDVAGTLADLDLEGVRVVQVLGSMANNSDVLTDALRRANVEVEANQALNREAFQAAKSFSAQMQLVKNDIDSAATEIGKELAPVILELTDDFREWIKEAKRTGEIREFAQGLADVFGVLARNMDLVVVAAGALVGLRLGAAFGPWGAAIGLVVGGLGSLIALSATATEEIDIHKSAVERLAGALDDLAGPAGRASEAARNEARAHLDAAIAKERNYQATLKLREAQLRGTFPGLPENTVGRSDAEIMAELGMSLRRGPAGTLPSKVQQALDTARELRRVQTAQAQSQGAVADAQADARLIEKAMNFGRRAPEDVDGPVTAPGGGGVKTSPEGFAKLMAKFRAEERRRVEGARRSDSSMIGGMMERSRLEAIEDPRRRSVEEAVSRLSNQATPEQVANVRRLAGQQFDYAEAIRAKAEADREAEAATRLHETSVAEINARFMETLPTLQRATAEADAWRKNALDGLDETAEGYDEFAAKVEEVYRERIAAALEENAEAQNNWATGAQRALKDYLEEATDIASQNERLWGGTLKNLEDAWVQWATTGKFETKSLVDFMLAELARIAFQQTVAPFLELGIQAIGSIFASSIGTGAATSSASSVRPVATLHGGGVSGVDSFQQRMVDPSIFANAPRFHDGLRPNEFPAVLEKGEGVFTPGQMRAMGGPNVEINIIDQRSGGDDIQTRKRTGSDGRTIFDIIVGEIQKDQDRNGPITRGFANTFGLSRQPSAGR